MVQQIPTATELGITIPKNIIEEQFSLGFRHSLLGGQICASHHLRRSFRFGYRAAALYLREHQRQLGVLDFPIQRKIRIRTA